MKTLTPASQRKALQAFPALRAVNRKVVDLGGKMSLVMGGIRTGMLNARGHMILAEGMTETNSKEIVIQLDSKTGPWSRMPGMSTLTCATRWTRCIGPVWTP